MNTKDAVVKNWFQDKDKRSVSVCGPNGDEWLGIKFQENPVSEVGWNGMCMLDILDAMIYRLRQFEAAWPCLENERSIEAMNEAKRWLEKKRDRRKKERLSLI